MTMISSSCSAWIAVSDDASLEEAKERKRGDEKDEKKGRGEGKKARRGSRPVSHDHELQWFNSIEVYTCDHC